jgi:rubrerythrin
MEERMDAYKALELIEELELSLAEMYGRLRQMFADDNLMLSLFSQLETEELYHSSLAAKQKQAVKGMHGDLGDMDFSYNRVKSVLNRIAVVRAMPRNKLSEILTQCYLIESSLVEEYVVIALRVSNKDISGLLETLSNGFRDHLTALAAWLKETGGEFGSAEALRRDPRVSFTAEVVVNGQVKAKSVDISESGIFLLTSQTFRQGELITMKFPVMDGTVSVSARVRYSVPNKGIGAAFSGIADEDRHLIRRYVEDCLHKQAEELRKKQSILGDQPPVA